jgi:hypothetical protein
MLATDIDVLVSEYASGFHLTRRHVECKGGSISILDRVLWLSGVRRLLDADASYLVVQKAEGETARFARDLGVQFLTFKQLEAWERGIKIAFDVWPGRSRYMVYDPISREWNKLSKNRSDEDWGCLRQIFAFVEVDSWLKFGYRHLNRLLRHLNELGSIFKNANSDPKKRLCCRYLTSALLVRFSHQLLAVCLEMSSIPESNTKDLLCERLTFGDQDSKHVSGLIESTAGWIRKALREKGQELPVEVDVDRLYSIPEYAKEFINLVELLLQDPDAATRLPIEMEVTQFSVEGQDNSPPRLQSVVSAGGKLVSTVKGFAMRAAGLSKELVEPIGRELRGV